MDIGRDDENVRGERRPLLSAGRGDSDAIGLSRTSSTQDRFSYRPRNIFARFATGTILRSTLRRSEIVRIPYRHWVKYLLITLLVILATVSTPGLLPRWVGFQPEWATSSDICQNPDEKLDALQKRVSNLADMNILREKLREHWEEVRCFNRSASAYYRRPVRYEWPDECSVNEAGSKTLSTEVCVGPLEQNSCVRLSSIKRLIGGIVGACRSVTVEKTCRIVSDGTRARELGELERLSGARAEDSLKSANESLVLNTANERAVRVISGLLGRIDIGSNLYIIYNVLALFGGTPLVLYKRSTGARMMGVAFGIRKSVFITSIVIGLTVFDTFSMVLEEVDFGRLLRNFRNDPCSVDARFSQARVELVLKTCAELGSIAKQRDAALQEMDRIYYLTRRFALCEKPRDEHPNAGLMDRTRKRFRDGDLSYRVNCNATLLDEMTSSSENNPSFSAWRTLLSTGIVAQLFLKVILSSWLVHTLAFMEPMIIHNGNIEMWDFNEVQPERGREGGHERRQIELNEREKKSVIAFARDRHLLPFVILSLLMILEVVLLTHSTWSFWSAPPKAAPGEGRMTGLAEEMARPYECIVWPP